MFLLIYTAIWLGTSLAVGVLGFMMGALKIVDCSPLPWVMHRGYVPMGPPPGQFPPEDVQPDRQPTHR